MFKLFRKYSKYLVAGGVTILMVVFLIDIGGQGGLGMGGPGDEVVGSIDGDDIKFSDLQSAQGEISLLGRLTNQVVAEDPLQWVLLQRDAERMGLSASDSEVNAALQEIGLKDEAAVTQRATKERVSVKQLRESVRHLLTSRRYIVLVRGLSNSGMPRISDALMRRVLADWMGSVRITALPVSAERYIAEVKEEDIKPEQLQSLFDQYKDTLPGDGKYGFGYREPNRVKLEYLKVPLARLTANIDVSEEEIISYYDANRDDFRVTPAERNLDVAPTPAPQDPTPEARRRIIETLRDRKAAELRDRMLKDAQQLLSANVNSLTMTAEGYREVPTRFEPVPMSRVADALREKHGVRPDVQQHNDRWLDKAALLRLADLGESGLETPSGQLTSTVLYTLSVKELEPGEDNALTSRRLQVGVPSLPVKDPDGNGYIFRVTDAAKARSPESLDQVRERVLRDARKLAAYEKLLKERERWEQRLDHEGPAALSQDLGVSLIKPDPFPRRMLNQDTRQVEVPMLDGVGSDAGFVDEVFALADRVNAAGGVEKATPAQRSAAIPVDNKLSLYLVRLDEYRPISRRDYELMAGYYGPNFARMAIFAEAGDDLGDDLSVRALAKRVGFEREGGWGDEEPATQAAE